MLNILTNLYVISVGCSLALVLSAIIDKGCAKRLEVNDWGDILSVVIISLFPVFNMMPILVFFGIKKVLYKPIHKE